MWCLLQTLWTNPSCRKRCNEDGNFRLDLYMQISINMNLNRFSEGCKHIFWSINGTENIVRAEEVRCIAWNCCCIHLHTIIRVNILTIGYFPTLLHVHNLRLILSPLNLEKGAPCAASHLNQTNTKNNQLLKHSGLADLVMTFHTCGHLSSEEAAIAMV